jgi:hypothetical protein
MIPRQATALGRRSGDAEASQSPRPGGRASRREHDRRDRHRQRPTLRYSTDGSPPVRSAFWVNCHAYVNQSIHVARKWWPDDYVCLTPGEHRVGWANGAIENVTSATIVDDDGWTIV